MDLSLLATAFIMGFLGSGHCIAMCGGIATTLQLSSAKSSSSYQYTLLYNLGRLLSYTVCGALVGGISALFASQSNYFSISLSFISSIFMILVGLYIMKISVGIQWIERAGKIAIWQHISHLNKRLLPLDSKVKALSYGALWGWLPCGLVYSALTWSMTTKSPLFAALFMACFAIGTFPAMISLGFSTQKLQTLIQKQKFRNIFGIILIIYGLYLLTIASIQVLL